MAHNNAIHLSDFFNYLVDKEEQAKKKENLPTNPNATIERLKAVLHDFNKKYKFKPGQIVKWKTGLKNRRRPNYDEPVIVVEVLEEPVFDIDTDASSSYFREPLDLVLGFIDQAGDFVAYYFDKRRFQPYSVN